LWLLCAGDGGVLCAVNRSSPYLLMAILTNLLAVLLQLLCKLKSREDELGFDIAKVTNIFATVFPAALLFVAYAIEGDDTGFENELLNDARHAFSCSFRSVLGPWLLSGEFCGFISHGSVLEL
jgi:hypothetical protein